MVEVSGVGVVVNVVVVDSSTVLVVVVTTPFSSIHPPTKINTISKTTDKVFGFIVRYSFLFLPIKMTIRDVGRYHRLPWAVAR